MSRMYKLESLRLRIKKSCIPEDKILTKNSWERKIFCCQNTHKDFLKKNWKRHTLDHFLQKLRTTSSTENTESGWPWLSVDSRVFASVSTVQKVGQSF